MSLIATVLFALASAASSSADIYTEPHNAAAAAAGTQNFIVGRMARECQADLGKPESFVQEFTAAWQARNQTYLEASVQYLGNLLTEVEKTQGPDAMKAVMAEVTSAVRGKGQEAVTDRFAASPDRKIVCREFVAQVEAGAFDFKAGYPLFKELSELVELFPAPPTP